MRTWPAFLLLCAACGDSGTPTTSTSDPQGTTTTAIATTTGTPVPDTTTGTPEPTTTAADSSTSTSASTSTGPEPTTGAALTTTTADPSTSTSTSGDTTTSTSSTTTADDTTSTSSTTSTTADDTTGDMFPACGVDVAAILDAFEECVSPGFFGQHKPIDGVTCWDICCAFGINNCGYRAAQDGFNACTPNPPQGDGNCDDVFTPNTSAQCFCLN